MKISTHTSCLRKINYISNVGMWGSRESMGDGPRDKTLLDGFRKHSHMLSHNPA